MIESLTVNLNGKVRKTRSKGINYLVAPVRMIVPGVLNGSDGPILYTAKENRKSVRKWNGVPLTDAHPKNGQDFVLADKAPHTHMGEVRNSGTDGEDLIAEAWFQVTKTKKVNNRIFAALTQGKKIELSTGLGMVREPAEEGAVFNGKPYTSIATNYQPDHLAILIDQKGACSLDDGCGVFNNDESDSNEETVLNDYFTFSQGDTEYRQSYSLNKNGDISLEGKPVEVQEETISIGNSSEDDMKLTPEKRTAIVVGLIANSCGCWNKGDEDTLNELSDEKLIALKDSSEKAAEKDTAFNAATKEFTGKDGTTFTFNSEEQKWDSKPPGKKEEGSEMNESGQALNEQPQTIEQYLASAPPEMQRLYANSLRVEKQKKEELVRKILVNVAEDDKQAKGDSLMAKDLEALEEIVDLLPTTNAVPSPQRINWGVSQGGSTSVTANQNEFADDQFLDEVALNFSKD
tara:strand:+ start:19079 stop:20461 length:1383 start_codon:yes stop_codon:yes gene_type:complete